MFLTWKSTSHWPRDCSTGQAPMLWALANHLPSGSQFPHLDIQGWHQVTSKALSNLYILWSSSFSLSMWSLGKDHVDSVRASDKGRSGMGWRERSWRAPGGRALHTYFSLLLKRSQGWNTFSCLCAVFFRSFLELDGSSGYKQQVPTRSGKISGSVWWSLKEERWGVDYKMFSKFLEHGDLTPAPSPTDPALPIRAAPTPAPPTWPCHPSSLEAEAALPTTLAALPIWEFRHLKCQRVCWHFPLSAMGLNCIGIDSRHSVRFLMSRPAAELLSVFLLSSHRAHISPSLSACDWSHQRANQFIRGSHKHDEVSRDDGMSFFFGFLTLVANS